MRYFLLILLTFISFSSLASISIISDLDDTIKITKASGKPVDTLLGSVVYTGMDDFLRAAKEYSNSLYVLSASPAFMSPIIRNTLKKRGIEYRQLILRKNVFTKKFNYKVSKIKQIMNASSDDFLFLGDDLGQDPEVYAEIKRLYPSRVLAIYIHSVAGRTNVEPAVLYWTSFDLFLREYLAGRMPSDWVASSAQKLLSEKNPHSIFPKKAHCPKTPTVYEWQLDTHFQPEANTLIEEFVSFCRLRLSANILP